MTRWLTGPKQPGLMILEHELTDQSTQAFMDAYPLMVSTGWHLQSAAEINGSGVYQNSKDSGSSVERVNGVLANEFLSIPPGSSSSSSTSASSSTPPSPSNTANGNPGSNTAQSGNNGSMQSTISKLAGAVGAIFLTVVFYAW